MGGRGAYYSGDAFDFEKREYDSIGVFKSDEYGNIKILKSRKGKATLPMRSISSNIYLMHNGDRLSRIGFYKDHNLTRQIDIILEKDDDYGIHAHDFYTEEVKNNYPVTKRVDEGSKKVHKKLTEKEKKLIKEILVSNKEVKFYE